MSQYMVTLSPAGDEINLTLQGPGIGEDGRRYVFANTARCQAFAEAVNFAYQQGLRDGMRGCTCRDRVLVVSGALPEELRVRPETWWERMKRQSLRLAPRRP